MSNLKETDFQDMSGEVQTVPARHGVAAFVPQGRTVKIINTYGKQVVSTWAFSLNAPPEKGKEDDAEDDTRARREFAENDAKTLDEGNQEAKQTHGEGNEHGQKEEVSKQEDAEEEEKSLKDHRPGKRTWASYMPSIPYRNKNSDNNSKSGADKGSKSSKETETANTRKWASYLPTGQGFSSYVPNVQVPDSKDVVSAFKSSHYRDPNKSYAEQLYDFSKTPVGAGGLAVATGSGTASSLYAAYSAYTQLNPSKNNTPPMEYLSLPHTRAATRRLVPIVNDTLLTNLRQPIITLIEDTSPGAHDTLTAACDANLYFALGVNKPEEHGSCAENLVLALKELNDKAGLKGPKAVGAEITVNMAPTPLHLFMNTPIDIETEAHTEGSGAKDTKFRVEEPKAKKRSFVRFRAERDVVIVMSACPMELGAQNGGRCMAANFMVEEAESKPTSTETPVAAKKAPRKLDRDTTKDEDGKNENKSSMPRPRGGPQKPAAVTKSAEAARRDSVNEDGKREGNPPLSGLKGGPRKAGAVIESAVATQRDDTDQQEVPLDANQQVKSGTAREEDASNATEAPSKEKKKPKKLERRSATPASS